MIKSRRNFVENGLLPYKNFCEKRDGHSKRERKKIIALHLKRIFAGTATNFSNKGFFSAKRHVTCHMTGQKYQFYVKMFRTLKTELCAKSGSIAMINFRNIAYKLFLPADEALFLVWGGHT